MAIIGMRELARETSRILEEVQRTGEPAIVLRHSDPVAMVVPIDREKWTAFVMANAPHFVAAMAEADADLEAGRTADWTTFRDALLEGRRHSPAAPRGAVPASPSRSPRDRTRTRASKGR